MLDNYSVGIVSVCFFVGLTVAIAVSLVPVWFQICVGLTITIIASLFLFSN